MPRYATVNKSGATLPKPNSLPQGAHVYVPASGPKTMTTGRGGKRTRRRSTRRRRTHRK